MDRILSGATSLPAKQEPLRMGRILSGRLLCLQNRSPGEDAAQYTVNHQGMFLEFSNNIQKLF